MTALLWFVAAAHAASLTLNPGDDVRTLTSSLQPGDVISFNPGTYVLTDALDWGSSGTAEQPIVFQSTGPGVILQLQGGWAVAAVREASFVTIRGIVFEGTPEHQSANGFPGIRLEDTSDVIIEDCEIRQTGGSGISMGGNHARVTVRRNQIHHTREGNGIAAGCGDASCWTEDSRFEGNWIHDLGGDYHSGITLNNGAQGNVILDNVIHDVPHIGIEVKSTEYGDPNEVIGNAVFSIGRHGIRAAGSARVQNNVVRDVGEDGIRGEDERDALENLVISHNTVYGAGDWGVRLSGWVGKPGMVLANNAISNTNGYGLRARDEDVDDGNRIVANVVSGLVEGREAWAEGGTAVLPGAGPYDFVDAASGDLYPSDDGGLVNAGDPAAESFIPADDFNGLPRDGANPDVGAYERFGSDNPGWPVAPGFKERTDNVPDDAEDVSRGCCGRDGEPAAALLLGPVALLLRRRRRPA